MSGLVKNRRIIVKSWNESEKEIREIYHNSRLSAYQSYDFLSIVGIGISTRAQVS